jgi:hypothetical protein
VSSMEVGRSCVTEFGCVEAKNDVLPPFLHQAINVGLFIYNGSL